MTIEVPALGTTTYTVQVGAFRVKSNADKLVEDLRTKGYEAIIVKKG